MSWIDMGGMGSRLSAFGCYTQVSYFITKNLLVMITAVHGAILWNSIERMVL
jgi:hypothetical protein